MTSGQENVQASGNGLSVSRRTALLGGAAMAALGVAGRAAAQESTPVPAEGPAFLFVQLAESGNWRAKPDVEDVYELTLLGVGSQSLYFSDRPERIVGTVPTDRFLEALGFTPVNPPNAAAVVRTPEGERDVLVIELFNPIYTREFDADGGGSLRYDARVLDAYNQENLASWYDEQDDHELPSAFSEISLFIDDCPDLTTCFAPDPSNPSWKQYAVGPIPNGPWGQCFNIDVFDCTPCNGATHDFYAGVCNREYPECNDWCHPLCTVGDCGGGGGIIL
jgi:hypothetical protein